MTLRGLPVLTFAVLLGLASLPLHADDLADVQRLVTAGDLDRALLRARQGPEPRKPALRFAEGVILMDLQRDAQALPVFESLVQDFPELPEPYNNIALIHARGGRLEAARNALDAALRNDPSNSLARRNLGEVYLQLALRSWEQAAAARPDDAALRSRLALARQLVSGSR